jgi:hypothetical protein
VHDMGWQGLQSNGHGYEIRRSDRYFFLSAGINVEALRKSLVSKYKM